MMYHIQAPDALRADIGLPASKSISNRALIINALCSQPTTIANLSECDDTDAMINALNADENGRDAIDIGAAGTAMRFLTAYLSAQNGRRTVISGSERMKNRPIKLLVDALRSVGAQIEYLEKEGFPPLSIDGRKLQGGDIYMDGGVSSQYISALLMIAPTMTDGLRLHLTGDVISQPYINLTTGLMRIFGAMVFVDGQTYSVQPQLYAPPAGFAVESDWSAASYWYEMMALCKDDDAEVLLSGLSAESMQGDAAIAQLFDKLGVKTEFVPSDSGVRLTKKQRTVDGLLTFDFTSMPDMAQTVVVTCIGLGIPFRFTGLQSLKIKETDRLNALRTEAGKFGCILEIQNDNTLQWDGRASCAQKNAAEQPPVVETYDDHRMAMAFAPLALCRENGVKINHPEVVSKSYPAYWDCLRKAGFLLKI